MPKIPNHTNVWAALACVYLKKCPAAWSSVNAADYLYTSDVLGFCKQNTLVD